MLKKYIGYIEKKNIPYYWNKRNNLIGSLNDSTQQNILNRLRRVVQDVDANLNDPNVIAKYLCMYSIRDLKNLYLINGISYFSVNGPDFITIKMQSI